MKIFIIFCLLLFSVSLFAEDKSRGCGAGTLLAPQKTLVSTTTAEVIDAFSFPTRPSAITTGTSGCTAHDIVKNEHQRQHFIASNVETLKFEVAIGEGERVVVLAQSFGCSGTLEKIFVDKVRTNYFQTFNTMDAGKISSRLQGIVDSSDELKGCVI